MRINIQKSVIIFLVILLLILIIIYIKIKMPNVVEIDYDNPANWVDEKGNDVKEINASIMTKGESYIDSIGQQYQTIATVFTLEGWYNGDFFQGQYRKDKQVMMRISPEMNPNDEIIEGYVLERLENGIPKIYVFLDEDWKRTLRETKIYWGKSYQNKRDFSFDNEISEGIYMMSVEDDLSRFMYNYSLHYGGLYVGVLKEDKTSTLISFS